MMFPFVHGIYGSLAIPPPVVPVSGLAAYWTLDEESGTRFDSHGDSDLAQSGGVGFDAGKLNNAADFVETSSQMLSIASNAAVNITGALSISGWIYPGLADASNRDVVSKFLSTGNNRQYGLFIRSGPVLRFICNAIGSNSGNNKILDSNIISLDAWTHFVAVFNPGVYMRIYINGSLDTEKTTDVPASLFSGAAAFRVGGPGGLGAYYRGRIDETALYNKALPLSNIKTLYGGGTPPAYVPGELGSSLIVSGSSEQFVVGIPQNNGAFFDGVRYWIFYQEGGVLKCQFGESLDGTSQTGGSLVTGVAPNGKAYSMLFGQVAGVWYAWAVVSRDNTVATEGLNVYRWELTAAGLGAVSSVTPSVADVNAFSTEVAHDYGGATVSRLYRIGRQNGANIRAIDAGLTNDADMGGWNLADADYGECMQVMKLTDGFIAFASNSGNNAGTEIPNAWERLKTNEGDAWGSEAALGFTNQKHASDTSHTGQAAICQLDDGTIYFAYCDDLDSVGGNYGRIVLKLRGNAQASTWSEISADVIGGDVGAWGIAIATDGVDVWIFYVKNSGGVRDDAIYYKKYDVSVPAFSDEVKLADFQAGHTFDRVYTQWRAHQEIVVVWSELGGGTWDVMAASVVV